MSAQVVIFDPEGIELEGELLTGNRAEVARARGVVCLPVVPDAIRRSAFAGWAKRSYGSGWLYTSHQGTRGCPIMLHASPVLPIIHWKAQVAVDASLGTVGGTLRLAIDTAQLGAHPAGLMPESNPVVIGALGEPDARGGWIVGGRARANIPADMFLALQLYGALAGARVQWFAVSQTA